MSKYLMIFTAVFFFPVIGVGEAVDIRALPLGVERAPFNCPVCSSLRGYGLTIWAGLQLPLRLTLSRCCTLLDSTAFKSCTHFLGLQVVWSLRVSVPKCCKCEPGENWFGLAQHVFNKLRTEWANSLNWFFFKQKKKNTETSLYHFQFRKIFLLEFIS